jgi:hypothetical protein
MLFAQGIRGINYSRTAFGGLGRAADMEFAQDCFGRSAGPMGSPVLSVCKMLASLTELPDISPMLLSHVPQTSMQARIDVMERLSV